MEEGEERAQAAKRVQKARNPRICVEMNFKISRNKFDSRHIFIGSPSRWQILTNKITHASGIAKHSFWHGER